MIRTIRRANYAHSGGDVGECSEESHRIAKLAAWGLHVLRVQLTSIRWGELASETPGGATETLSMNSLNFFEFISLFCTIQVGLLS